MARRIKTDYICRSVPHTHGGYHAEPVGTRLQVQRGSSSKKFFEIVDALLGGICLFVIFIGVTFIAGALS